MRTALTVVLLAMLVASTPAQNGEGSEGGREGFSAVALSAGGPRTNAVAAQLAITIERWSTEAERQRLLSTLGKGQSAMLETLRDLPSVGSIRQPGNLGWDLHYAHQMPGEDGGRRIFLATDRPIGIWETLNNARTIDYPFTFIELRVNRHGEGEGKLTRATKVVASEDGRFVHLENWEHEPVALTQVEKK
jgi:hypothetical protein